MWSQEKYLEALDFAAQAHGLQKVPGKEYSYVVHLCNVCMEVLAAYTVSPGFDVDLAMQCALLHDTIEDTATGFDAVAQRFGAHVAAGVLALSRNKALPAAKKLADSLERIKQQPPEIGIVKLADRITNLQPPPPFWSREKIKLYKAEAEQILTALSGCNACLAERLAAKIGRYAQYEL